MSLCLARLLHCPLRHLCRAWGCRPHLSLHFLPPQMHSPQPTPTSMSTSMPAALTQTQTRRPTSTPTPPTKASPENSSLLPTSTTGTTHTTPTTIRSHPSHPSHASPISQPKCTPYSPDPTSRMSSLGCPTVGPGGFSNPVSSKFG